MSQTTKKVIRPRRLKVWQRLFLAVALVVILILCSTLFTDFGRMASTEKPVPDDGTSGWTDPVYAYVVAEEGSLTVPFFNEALAEEGRCGRGAYVELESWEPFVAEDGREYYHAFLDGQYGYLRVVDVSDDKSDVLQETQVYVRTPVTLTAEPDGIATCGLARKGELLRIVGYDYFRDDGMVNMYEVKLGTEIGWIHSEYVSPTYAESLENWTNEYGSYENHVMRGDSYGGGDAADLDYWPHRKGDFADDGNAMPDSCYALHISPINATTEMIERYLELAEGTAINTFVFTIFDEGQLAYASPLIESHGLLEQYNVGTTLEEYQKAVRMVQDAGYYTVARITVFKDSALAQKYPEWSITDLNGSPMKINDAYWPSAFCRDVWEYKLELALEVVDTFGFQEVQFDYVRFPDYIINYENEGTVDLKNLYGESKAQAVQRFLIYVSDVLHSHGVYVSADVFGETSNNYVAPYGQYWDAISTVVDVISGMPYPDHYSSYWTRGGNYRPYEHPYETLDNWAAHVALRQSECSSPAIVRTWIQAWDDPGYAYDELAVMREITALYDNDITGGYMPWYSLGSLYNKENLGGAINYDYYALYLEAEAAGVKLSEYMGVDTSE